MIRLLRSDAYKLVHMKALIVSIIILIVLSVANVVLGYYSNESMKDQTFLDENGIEISYYNDSLTATAAADQAFGEPVMLIIAIVVSIFIAGEFGYGTIKNTGARGFSRTKLYFSKSIWSYLIAIGFVIIYALGTIIPAVIIWGTTGLTPEFWASFMQVVGIQLLLTISYTSIFVTVAFLVRQSGSSMAINICGIMFASMGFQLLQALLQYAKITEVNVSQYWLGSLMMQTDVSGMTGEFVMTAIITSICYYIGVTILGLGTFMKRDIK